MRTVRHRGRPALRRFVVAALCAVPFAHWGSRAGALEPSDWLALKRAIRDRYPDVQHIKTGELHRMLERGEPPLLIDARTASEYRVSHLKGARRAESVAQAMRALEPIPKDGAVVVYCSVGYRSAALARALAKAGYTRVANLEGSIFEWANEGLPLWRGSEPAYRVHPYDARWGTLLDRRLWSAERP